MKWPLHRATGRVATGPSRLQLSNKSANREHTLLAKREKSSASKPVQIFYQEKNLWSDRLGWFTISSAVRKAAIWVNRGPVGSMHAGVGGGTPCKVPAEELGALTGQRNQGSIRLSQCVLVSIKYESCVLETMQWRRVVVMVHGVSSCQ